MHKYLNTLTIWSIPCIIYENKYSTFQDSSVNVIVIGIDIGISQPWWGNSLWGNICLIPNQCLIISSLPEHVDILCWCPTIQWAGEVLKAFKQFFLDFWRSSQPQEALTEVWILLRYFESSNFMSQPLYAWSAGSAEHISSPTSAPSPGKY